jgi:hypothetical protein
MKRKTTLVLALWAMLTSSLLVAQKGSEQQMEKEANALFTSGEFLKAYPLYSQLVSLYPNHPDYNYKFGACAIFSDPDKTKAIKFLNIATKKSVEDPMVWYYLGKAYHLNYQFKEAVKSYEKFMATADSKITSKTDAQRNIETCIYGTNLLSNVKDVTVISKTESDKQNFFRYMNLDGIGGKIVTVPEELKSNLDKKSKTPGVIHYPGNSSTIYFSSLGKDGQAGRDIYSAVLTPDGKYTQVQAVKGDVNSKYDEDFCFMHSDGKTLYFSSKGHNSMGGFDIFKAELDPNTGTFGKAINLDFAINTPDDDIFYIADSLNQRAYFASGRSSDLDHLHVYNVMVTSQPMQVVYLKGLYANAIDAEELKATFQIVDNTSNKITSDGTTNASSGDYLGFVEHSGEYTMKVKTSNSPTVHEVKMLIPKFDKPVALRQEMKLVNEGGQEKLIVTNFFETPLDTDLSDLASEMLRRKAKLDVNATPDKVQSTPAASISSTDGENDIRNVALAAGFSDSETPAVVADQMKNSVAGIRASAAQTAERSKYAQMYAAQKHSEAEKSLKEAEAMRKSTSGFNTEDDIAKIKASLALTSKAEELQRESEAALTAADMEDKQVKTLNERASKLEEQEKTLRQSMTTEDYGMALQTLNNEKQRRKEDAPTAQQANEAELIAQIATSEQNLSTAENKLVEMRANETRLKDELKAAQTAMETAKKDKDKQATEFAYINKKSELDALRKNIKTHQVNIKTLGSKLADADADLALYQNLITTNTLGISTPAESLTDTERLALGMKLKGMDNRLSSLEITDQNTLALLGDIQTAPTARTTTKTSLAASANTESPKTEASADVVADVNTNNASSISSLDAPLAMVLSTPTLQPAKHMLVSQSIVETDRKIVQYEKMKRDNNITVAQNQELMQLNTKRNELQMQLAGTPVASTVLTEEEARDVYTEIAPDYSTKITEIANGNGTAVDQAMAMLAYRQTLNLQIADARLKQAQSIGVQSDSKTILDMAARDARLEAAQQKLVSEPSELALVQRAYEMDNKAIIESNAVYNAKLQDQIAVTENYIGNLSSLIKSKQTNLDLETDQAKAIQMRTELGMLKQEQEKANNKLESYLKDLQLTTSASTPTGDGAAVAMNMTGVSTEKVVTAPVSTSAANNTAVLTADTKKVETILKPRVEQESVFAYESSLFEELIAKYETPNNKISNRDKIQKINDEIFLIEAEMENEKNEGKLRKLDYKAEQMYLQRAESEIANAPVISTFTIQAFGEEHTRAKDMVEAKKAEIAQSTLVQEEINALMTSAQSNMSEAEELRKAAPAKMDDIEKADMYRLAFAKEALSIQQLKQVQDITENIDVFKTYTDAEIASMRAGRVPTEEPTTLAIGVSGTADVTNADASLAVSSDNTSSSDSVNPSDINTTKSTSMKSADRQGAVVKSDAVKGSDLIQNSTVALKSTEANAAKTATKEAAVSAGNDVASTNLNSTANAANSSAPSKSSDASVSNGNLKSSKDESVVKDIARNFPVAPRNASEEERMADASEASNNAADYLFSAPTVLKNDLFMRTPRAVYSENKPIPMDIVMPKGIYYKVQVGAFRNDIPQNLYDQFAPVCGEKVKNGITRYTAGFFITLNSANDVKKSIRALGYSDAFVVAYRDGKRIPLYEALGQTNGDIAAAGPTNTPAPQKASDNFQKAIEQEYIQGDGGEAPKAKATAPAATTNAETTVPLGKLQPDYYVTDGKAVQADQVEKIEGLFFTVQVGVYSKPVNSALLGYITPLNTELLKDSKLRYTSGRYTNMKDASYKRDQAKSMGINDAFITAYYNGLRITISEADRLLGEKGPSVLAK